MLKVTTVKTRIGLESAPIPVELNGDGYVLLPETDDDGYHLYAPFKDRGEDGPWFFVRFISRREAKQARRTVVGLYEDRDLVPHLLNHIGLPPPMSEQTHWMVYGCESFPIGIINCPTVQ